MHLKPLALLLLAASATAQDVAPPTTEMRQVEDGAPATAAETPAPEAAPAPSPRPRPAMMAPLATRSILLGIARAGSRFVAVGERGHVLLSEDGTTWTQVAVPVNSMLNRVRFRDERHGWAVGHDATIIATTDGGRTWTLQHFDPEARPLYDVIFLDDARLSAIGGYGGYYDSPDSGRTWAPRSFPIGDLGQHFNAAARLGDGSLLVAGERGLLMRSRDNAETWELLASPYTGSFFGALPAGDRGALVHGLRGHVYLADDVSACPTMDPADYDPYTRETVTEAAELARIGWRPIESPTTEGLFGSAATDGGALLVGVNGVLVRIDMAQATAARVDAPPLETLNDVVRDGDRWLAVGRRGIQDLGALP